MLLLSLRRFLAFCSMLFPRSSFLHLSYSLLLFFVSYTRFTDSSFSLSRVCPFSLSLPFSPSFCISLSFLSPDRAFHSKIERQHACRAHFSSWKHRIPTRWHARATQPSEHSCCILTSLSVKKFYGLIDIDFVNTCKPTSLIIVVIIQLNIYQNKGTFINLLTISLNIIYTACVFSSANHNLRLCLIEALFTVPAKFFCVLRWRIQLLLGSHTRCVYIKSFRSNCEVSNASEPMKYFYCDNKT